jgi:hypothetical protein
LAPPGSINHGFFLRENLLLCASYLPLGVPNERVCYTPSITFKDERDIPWARRDQFAWLRMVITKLEDGSV